MARFWPVFAQIMERLETNAGWEDLPLAEPQRQRLREIAGRVRHLAKIREPFGPSANSSPATGVVVVFAGPSGPVQAMAAALLANDLDLDLLRVDLGQVISKYIGETENNLQQVFEQAASSGAVLFFDQADALFGQRTEPKDGSDRYPNLEVSYLLQRIKSYSGLVILATNLAGAMGRAFGCRLDSVVEFPGRTEPTAVEFGGIANQVETDAAVVAQQLLDAWNGRDLDRFEILLSEDIEWYDPAMPHPPARGRAEVRAFAEAVLRAFPDFHYEVRYPLCVASDGSRCAIPWRITATHTAPLVPPGFAPTHRRLCQEGVDLLDVRGGQVIRILTCFDTIAATEQLLALTLRPARGTLRERLLVLLQRLLAARARRLSRS